MKNEIVTKMSPEGLEIANNYLELGNIQAVCLRMKLDENTVQEYLGKREIKAYIDQVYLDTGYRNRFSDHERTRKRPPRFRVRSRCRSLSYISRE